MRYDQDSCPKCGAPKRKPSKQCGACWRTSRRKNMRGLKFRCIDCSGRLGDKGHRAERCWACHLKRIQSRKPTPCSVEGCQRPHRAKSYCSKHYQGRIAGPKARTGTPGLNASFHSYTRLQPCQLCDYSAMNSHAHRLIPGKQGGGYTEGNVVALCARCHEEVHRGLAASPVPLILSNM